VPLANAAWPHEAIGQTNVVSAETMGAFVSAQVHAIENAAYAPRIGFAWAPNAAEPSYTEEGRDVVLAELARALLAAYEEPDAVCADDACEGDVEGATFNEAWKTFATWD
jgi:hypothetical protein